MPGCDGTVGGGCREILHRHRIGELAHELSIGYVERGDRHDGSAGKRRDVREKRQQRQSEQQRIYPRQDQHFDGIDARRLQGIDFFIDLHHANFGREGGAGPPGDQNRRDQHSYFP